MSTKQKAEKRKIEKQIRISASADAVWKALTDADELARWFPLEAKVQPGEGGSIWYSWGPPWQADAKIRVWNPGKLLGVGQEREVTAGPDHGGEFLELSTDYILESHGGETVLRLVHSGFGTTSDWDDEYDATNRGWEQVLMNLKHYLENHAGTERRVAWTRTALPITSEEAWRKTAPPSALFPEGSLEGKKVGDPYRINLANGESYEGTLLLLEPPFGFVGTVKNLNNSLLMFWIEHWSKPALHSDVVLMLSGYGLLQSQIIAIQDAWSRTFARIFP